MAWAVGRMVISVRLTALDLLGRGHDGVAVGHVQRQGQRGAAGRADACRCRCWRR
jgi:hypothetical protein